MLDCWWKKDFYVAFQSTNDHYKLHIYTNPTRSLKKALSSTKRWVKQTYQMSWVELIDPWFLAHRGAEILLWTNELHGERGVTMRVCILDCVYVCQGVYQHANIYARVCASECNGVQSYRRVCAYVCE